MSYIKRVLQPGETIMHVNRLHWIVYLPGWIVLILGILGAILLSGTGRIFVYSALVVAGVGVVILAIAWIKRVSTEIAVTNKRLIYKEGFISRRTMEMNMDKIESIDVIQPIMGRLLDYGTILVRGTGSGLEPLNRIDSPIELRNSVMMNATPHTPAGAAAARKAG